MYLPLPTRRSTADVRLAWRLRLRLRLQFMLFKIGANARGALPRPLSAEDLWLLCGRSGTTATDTKGHAPSAGSIRVSAVP